MDQEGCCVVGKKLKIERVCAVDSVVDTQEADLDSQPAGRARWDQRRETTIGLTQGALDDDDYVRRRLLGQKNRKSSFVG